MSPLYLGPPRRARTVDLTDGETDDLSSITTKYESSSTISNQSTHQHIQRDLNIYHGQLSREEVLKQARSECLERLSLTDPREHRDVLRGRTRGWAKGTCEWILKSEELAVWHAGDSNSTRMFWLNGHPGTGKSTMSLFLTDSLEREFKDRSDRILVYFFCDANSEDQNMATRILQGLLYQMCQRHSFLLDDYLLPEYRNKKAKLFSSVQALWRIFEAMLGDRRLGRVYCIIDAMDECESKSRDELLQQIEQSCLSNLEQCAKSDVRILITSRPYTEISYHLADFYTKDFGSFEEVKKDVKLLIDENVSKLVKRKGYHESLRQEVAEKLASNAEGTFLWVGLACSELMRVDARKARSLLERLPAGLDAIYKDLLGKAIEQNKDEADLVKQVLAFVSMSLRPVTLMQISIACDLQDPDVELEGRELFTREIVEMCRSMVVVDGKTVRLLHKSVKDFLFSSMAEIFPSQSEVHGEIAHRCLRYLDTALGNSPTAKTTDDEFMDYAASAWPDHARLAKEHFEVGNSAPGFFHFSSDKREEWLNVLCGLGEDIPLHFSLFHVAAKWSIMPLLEYAKSDDFLLGWEGVSSQSPSLEEFKASFEHYGGNPLEAAVVSKNCAILEELLALRATQIDGKLKIFNTKSTTDHSGTNLDEQICQFPVTQNVLRAATRNTTNGHEMWKILFRVRPSEYVISESLLCNVIRNQDNGPQMLKVLLEQSEDSIVLNDRIARTAVSNEKSGTEVIKILLTGGPKRISYTPRLAQIILEHCDMTVIASFLGLYNQSIHVDEQLLNAVASNKPHKKRIIDSLLGLPLQQFEITSETVEIVVQNFDPSVLRLILPLSDFRISERLVALAAANTEHGDQLLTTLLEKYDGDCFGEKALEAAARNDVKGPEIMKMLLDRVETHLQIPPEVLEAVVSNPLLGCQIFDCLFQSQKTTLQIGDGVFKAALEFHNQNLQKDKTAQRNAMPQQIVSRLMAQEEYPIVVTAAVVKAAVKTGNQKQLHRLIMDGNTSIFFTPSLMTIAVEECNMEDLYVLLDKCEPHILARVDLVSEAVRIGDRAKVEALVKREPDTALRLIRRARALSRAAANSDHEMEQFLLEGISNDDRRILLNTKPPKFSNALLHIDAHDRGEVKDMLKNENDLKPKARGLVNTLRWAAASGHTEKVRKILAAGASVNIETYEFVFALKAAVSNGHAQIVQILLEADVLSNFSADEIESILQTALRLADTRVVLRLFRAGIRPRKEHALLNISVRKGLTKAKASMSLLLRNGVDVSAQDPDEIPTICLASDRSLDLCKRLYDAGCDIYATSKRGCNALYFAALAGRTEIVEWLLQLGVPVNGQDNRGFTPLHAAATKDLTTVKTIHAAGGDLTICNHSGVSVLYSAASSAKADIVEWLVTQNVDIHQPDNYGFTPFMVAIRRDLTTAKVFYQAGAPLTTTSRGGFGTLYNAVNTGNVEVVEWLLSLNVDIGAKNDAGFTPIFGAVLADLNLAKMLYYAGADVTDCGNNNRTTLHTAGGSGKSEVIEWLLSLKEAKDNRKNSIRGAKSSTLPRGTIEEASSRPADIPSPEVSTCPDQDTTCRTQAHRYLDINAQDNMGKTPLHSSIYSLDVDTVRCLLDHNAMVDVKNRWHHQTPLFTAVHTGAKQIAMLLVERGADQGTVDRYGRTVVDWLKLLGTNNDLLEAICEDSSTPANTSKSQVRQMIVSECKELLEAEDYSQNPFSEIGRCFIMLDELEDARFVLAKSVKMSDNGQVVGHYARCDLCSIYPITGKRFICKACIDTDLCETCMEKYLQGKFLDQCARHDFIHTPAPTSVDIDRDELREWLSKTIAKYSEEVNDMAIRDREVNHDTN